MTRFVYAIFDYLLIFLMYFVTVTLDFMSHESPGRYSTLGTCLHGVQGLCSICSIYTPTLHSFTSKYSSSTHLNYQPNFAAPESLQIQAVTHPSANRANQCLAWLSTMHESGSLLGMLGFCKRISTTRCLDP